MVVVAKFGGSSVANSEQFKKVKDIVTSNPSRKVIVVSALGKKNPEDSKITDLLYLLHAHLKYNVSYTPVWEMITTRFNQVKEDLGLNIDINQDLITLQKELSKEISVDYLVSRGEYLTSKLMAEYLNYTFVDASEIVKFNYDGTVDQEQTYALTLQAVQKYNNVVIPGFYGAYPNGTIKTFSRGGSDITGALVARSINASEYENWTDVSGVLIADPRIIKGAKSIKEITYSELRELSYMGASVLHEETIFPVQELNIPIHIKNTNAPLDEGTIITNESDDTSQIITGISGKKNFTSFTVTKKQHVSKTKIILDVLQIFSKHKINIEHIPSSIDSFSIVVSSSDVQKRLYDLVSEIERLESVECVSVDKDIALVAVVGRNMITKPGISGKIFGILGNNNVNIKMIAQGSQEINIIVGVSNEDFEKAIKAVYDNIVK